METIVSTQIDRCCQVRESARRLAISVLLVIRIALAVQNQVDEHSAGRTAEAGSGGHELSGSLQRTPGQTKTAKHSGNTGLNKRIE